MARTKTKNPHQQFEDALRLIDVLEVTFAERVDRDAFGKRAADQRARRRGQEHLPAAADSAQPGGPDDVDAEVSLAADRGFTGVQAHAHADHPTVRPVVAGMCALRLDGGRDRVPGPREREEEGIALGVDLDTQGEV